MDVKSRIICPGFKHAQCANGSTQIPTFSRRFCRSIYNLEAKEDLPLAAPDVSKGLFTTEFRRDAQTLPMSWVGQQTELTSLFNLVV